MTASSFPSPTQRAKAVALARRRLQERGFPRLQMTLLVALTGTFGLLASFAMLRLGVEAMALRYPLAVGLAYLFFLLLMWLWLRTQASDYLDVPSELPLPASRSGSGPAWRSGDGGDFAGAGADASFDAAEAPHEAVGAVADAASAAEGAPVVVPLLALVFGFAMAFASLYLVYIAPLLFAEVLVDGALSYALFRHLRGLDPQHWLAATVRRSVLPFLATAVFMAATGFALTAYEPAARSISEVFAPRAAR